MKLLPLIIAITLVATHARAEDTHKIAVIKEILTILDAQGSLEKMRIENVTETRNLMLQQAGEKATNPMMKRLIDRAMEKYADYSKEIFDWSQKEKEYLEFYDEGFTESEIENLLAFYKTDTGRALIRAQTLYASKTQQTGFQNEAKRNARIDQIMKETIAEVQAELKKEGAIP
jgi:hypothetical protein